MCHILSTSPATNSESNKGVFSLACVLACGDLQDTLVIPIEKHSDRGGAEKVSNLKVKKRRDTMQIAHSKLQLKIKQCNLHSSDYTIHVTLQRVNCNCNANGTILIAKWNWWNRIEGQTKQTKHLKARQTSSLFLVREPELNIWLFLCGVCVCGVAWMDAMLWSVNEATVQSQSVCTVHLYTQPWAKHSHD